MSEGTGPPDLWATPAHEESPAERLGREFLAAGWTWQRSMVAFGAFDGGDRGTAVVVSVHHGEPLTNLIHFQESRCAGIGLGGLARLIDPVPDPTDDGFVGHAIAQLRRRWAGWQVDLMFGGLDPRTMPCTVRLLRGDGRRHMVGGMTSGEALLAAFRYEKEGS